MVVLEAPTPDVASAAVGLLDASDSQLSSLNVDANAVTPSSILTVDESSVIRGSASMKMVPKRYTNLHSWLALGPVSTKQIKEAMVKIRRIIRLSVVIPRVRTNVVVIPTFLAIFVTNIPS